MAAGAGGRRIEIPAAQWNESIIAGQKAISDAAVAVIDFAAEKARASAGSACRDLLLAVTVLLFALILAVAAILIVQLRVVGGLLKLVDCMRQLATETAT